MHGRAEMLAVLGKKEGGSICVGESETPWPFEIGSSLLYHYGTGFMVDPGYVSFEEKITGQIDFTGPTIDQKSGGLTGTDTLGGTLVRHLADRK